MLASCTTPNQTHLSDRSGFRYSRGVLSPGRHVRTRLYFTSESHVHSLLSIFRYGALLDVSVSVAANNCNSVFSGSGHPAAPASSIAQLLQEKPWHRARPILPPAEGLSLEVAHLLISWRLRSLRTC